MSFSFKDNKSNFKPGFSKNLEEIKTDKNEKILLDEYTEEIENEIEYEKSIKLNPSQSDCYYYMGMALESIEEYEEAIEAFEYALELEPKNGKYKQALREIMEKY